jgi:uncharacterized protein YlxW (UPF0749 family)
VTETMASDRTWTRPRRVGWVLVIAIVSFILGVSTGKRDVEFSKNAISKLQTEKRDLDAETKGLRQQLNEAQAKLKNTQMGLAELMPSPNVYEISPNRSRIVSTGHLTIGFVGTPGNQNVELNINDKSYSAIAGQTIQIPIEQSLTCRVEVMSISVIDARVMLNASCIEVKH